MLKTLTTRVRRSGLLVAATAALALSAVGAGNAEAGVTYPDGKVFIMPFTCNVLTHTIRSGANGIAISLPNTGPYGTTVPAGTAYYWYWVKNLRTGQWVYQSSQWLQPGQADGGVYLGAGPLTQYAVYVRYARWVAGGWGYTDEWTTDFIQGDSGSHSSACFA
jgi:hypothetical protein